MSAPSREGRKITFSSIKRKRRQKQPRVTVALSRFEGLRTRVATFLKVLFVRWLTVFSFIILQSALFLGAACVDLHSNARVQGEEGLCVYCMPFGFDHTLALSESIDEFCNGSFTSREA